MKCCGVSECNSTSLKKDDFDFVKVCRALGNETRVQIVRTVIDKGVCICSDFVKSMPQSQSTISQHLKVLKEADILLTVQDGPKSCMQVNKNALEAFKNYTQTFSL
jgi:DNA-binding transcriptional ArsR family regulator